MIKKRISDFVIIVVVFCIASIYYPGNILNPKNKSCDIYILNKKNMKVSLNIEVAETDENLMKGLMYQKHLDENSGMLFVFDDEAKRSFWMKNTYIPLSIAFISRDGVINEIYDMAPLDTSITYPSKKIAKYALEVNKGWFAMNNISEGSRLILNGCLGK